MKKSDWDIYPTKVSKKKIFGGYLIEFYPDLKTRGVLTVSWK